MVPREAPELLKRRSGLCGRALSPWKRRVGLRGAVNTEVQAHFKPAALRHHDELLDRRHEHLQPLERADREREVALGVVEALDVAADLVHHRLARLRLRLDVAHLDEELGDRLGARGGVWRER